MELKRLVYTRPCVQRMTTCLVFFECARCGSSRTPTPHSDGAKDLMLQHPVVKEVTKIGQMRQNSGAEKLNCCQRLWLLGRKRSSENAATCGAAAANQQKARVWCGFGLEEFDSTWLQYPVLVLGIQKVDHVEAPWRCAFWQYFSRWNLRHFQLGFAFCCLVGITFDISVSFERSAAHIVALVLPSSHPGSSIALRCGLFGMSIATGVRSWGPPPDVFHPPFFTQIPNCQMSGFLAS